MNILVINCGSSSIKYKFFRMPQERLLSKGAIERIGEKGSPVKNHRQGLGLLLKGIGKVEAVGHRVVHGAEEFKQPALINERVIRRIKVCSQLAPLHNPANLEGILACRQVLKGTKQAAVFDTAFHQSLPQQAFVYGLPYKLYQKHGIRKYGFHGSSHEYVAIEAARSLGRAISKVNLITCHLGNGCSVSAIRKGRCVDTSMGFTPLEGLVMGTRSGDIDPALITYLIREKKMPPESVDVLLNKESGLKGISGVSNDVRNIEAEIAKGNERAIKLKQQVDDVKAYAIHNRLIKPKAVYRFFECKSEKNSILIYDKGKEIERLEFPRQKQDEFLSVPDFVSSRETDSMALFVTCCGEGILNKCTELREKGEYLKSHMLQVLAIESAEAFAEIVHRKIRESWGIPDKDISMEDIFKAKYTGIRLSYGYPACPNLDDQQKLFKLLKPEQIGVHLTEGMMMDPEASVSALVFHHPQAKYFRV